ncbi:MAG: hypothetical protein GY801_28135 [bacterium]|nr:hypothetical protein [bacterium]
MKNHSCDLLISGDGQKPDMKIFHPESEQAPLQNAAELDGRFDALEQTLGELRQLVGQRRTMLKNAEKKLQEFQDSMYAMLIEDEFPRKRVFEADDEDGDEL